MSSKSWTTTGAHAGRHQHHQPDPGWPSSAGLNEGDLVATGTISGQPLQEGVPSRSSGEVMSCKTLSRGRLWSCCYLLAALTRGPRVRPRSNQFAQTLSQANQALQAGEADKALGLISLFLEGGAQSAEAQNSSAACATRLSNGMRPWPSANRRFGSTAELELSSLAGPRPRRKSKSRLVLNAFSLGKRVRREFEDGREARSA